jgi:hypothetical protein
MKNTIGLIGLTVHSLLNNIDPGLLVQSLTGRVTYPDIGTFTIWDFYDPIYRPVVVLPQSPETINTLFSLYTQTNPTAAQPLRVGENTTITVSNFVGTNPTKFIVHGYIDNPDFSQWMEELKDLFLKTYDCNVIIVDWRGGNLNDYIQVS